MNSRGKRFWGKLLPLVFVFAAFGTVTFADQAREQQCRVAIDVGHTLKQPGATSARGVGEFIFNQRTARLLREVLNKRSNVASFLLNEDGGSIRLQERTEQANTENADLLVSIHHDSVQPRYLSSWVFAGKTHRYSDHFHGYSLFYSLKNQRAELSLALASRIGSHLRTAGFTPTPHHAEAIEGENRELVDPYRGVYRFDDLVVLKTAAMPAVLLECGVILNRDEELLLGNLDYQLKLISAVADAVADFCRSDLGVKTGQLSLKSN